MGGSLDMFELNVNVEIVWNEMRSNLVVILEKKSYLSQGGGDVELIHPSIFYTCLIWFVGHGGLKPNPAAIGKRQGTSCKLHTERPQLGFNSTTIINDKKKHKVTHNLCIHCSIFTKLHRLARDSALTVYTCAYWNSPIAPPAGGWKRHSVSTPRIWSNSSYRFNVNGFRLGQDVRTCSGPIIAACSFNFHLYCCVSHLSTTVCQQP